MIFKASLFVVGHSESLNNSALTVLSNYLGTDHYLLPGGGGRILGGITWFLGEQKGGISRNLEPTRGGSLKTLEGFRGVPLKFAWKMKTWEHRESHQMLLGGSLQ